MTKVIDNVLIKSGFDACEVKTDRSRGWLYLGSGVMIVTSLIFLGLIFV